MNILAVAAPKPIHNHHRRPSGLHRVDVYTVSNAIYELVEGKSAQDIADELGWDLDDVMEIHPKTIEERKLTVLADKHYWPYEHVGELRLAIKKYRSKS